MEDTIIQPCNNCGKKNRIKITNDSTLRFKCGNCRSRIYIPQKSHIKLIKSVYENMSFLYNELSLIQFPAFAQTKIAEIEKKMEKNISKIESMLIHIEYINDEEEKKELKRLYSFDLNNIENILFKIEEEIKNKRWLKNQIEKYNFIGRFLFSSKQVTSIVVQILSYFSIDISFLEYKEN